MGTRGAARTRQDRGSAKPGPLPSTRPKTSFEKTLAQADALAALAGIAPLLRVFGDTGRRLADSLADAQRIAGEAHDLVSLPSRFNSLLGPRGWVAYDRMKSDVLRRATELAEAGQIDEADDVLATCIEDPEWFKFQLTSMLAVKAYRPRAALLSLAADDYHAGRYHACVPVVLAQIDGIVADVLGEPLFQKTKSIARKLVAWDSIAGQEDGLPGLVQLFAQYRSRTTDSPINVPYRNGILHGRDLGYANRLVAAKAWAALFALREWAVRYERGEVEPPPVAPEPTLIDRLRRLADVERQRKAIEAWTPRPEFTPLEVVLPLRGTPEEALARWLEAWKARDFGQMAEWTQRSMRRSGDDIPEWLRESYGYRELAGFRVERVRDIGAAMTEVEVMLSFEGDADVRLTANVVFEGPAGDPLVRGTAGGRWGVNHVSALRQQPAD